MAEKVANYKIFALLGLIFWTLIISFVDGTEDKQLWAATLKEKALGEMQKLILPSEEKIWTKEQ